LPHPTNSAVETRKNIPARTREYGYRSICVVCIIFSNG
jgi:hypothetical protein